MLLVVIFALTLAGTGIFFGQNPHAPDAPILIEKTNPELGYAESESDTSRNPASSEPVSYYTTGVHLTPRLGYETIIYNQAGAPSLTQTSFRANVDLIWFVPKSPYEVEFRFNFTALPVATNQSNITAQFFGANADFGYSVAKTSFLKFRILGGVYYTSTAVTERSFGYPPLIFPELYPALTLYLFDNMTLDVAYRYMYLGALFDSSQTQIVRSLGVSVFINDHNSISAMIEDNGFSLLLPAATRIQYYSMGLTLGFSF